MEFAPMSRRFLLIAAFAFGLASPLAAQPKPAAPAGGQNSSFNLVNRGALAVRELFVTSGGNANWGQNRLDGKTNGAVSIAPGGSFAVRRKVDTNCIFDIRVVFADGKPEERKGVNTCAMDDVVVGAGPASNVPVAATGKPADDPSFKLFNRSARNITELRAAPTGGSTGGDNRLSSPVPPDGSRPISLPRDGHCIFDLRLVFADGKAMEKKKANLCKISDLPVP